ncbi:hypothetical protein [Mycolicibacterium alvei]|uniref:Uncharacterized protein n=1 Tax=Mycolicibacterium alvei TaxID=67081 RepID=A0A6N4V006_9MYCO|nr:hypothetical protein [Mycolicibacterium alvei]MCV7003534.1 hypothetical protein [Mycolicibacterium alvei]BBX30510.1 hypothetical protein MALV_56350 [Mycolicibacterium alvei]
MLQTVGTIGDLSLDDGEPSHISSAGTPAALPPAKTTWTGQCRAPVRLRPQTEPTLHQPPNRRTAAAGPMTAESMCAHRERRRTTGSMWRKR